MNEPWQRYFDISIVHFMAYPETIGGNGPILETLTEIAEDPFFTAVEVGRINDRKVRREAAKLLEQAHLRVGFGAQPILLSGKYNLNSPDRRERERAIAAVKEGINQAYELNAERLAILSGPAPADPAAREEQLALLVDSINRICEYAAGKGKLGITLETFDPDIAKRALIGSHQDAARVAAAVRKDHPSFGILVDLSHLPLQRESAKEALAAVADHLVHVHVGNCVMRDPAHPAYGDEHPRFGIAGGENDVPQMIEFIEALFELDLLNDGRRPFFGFEVKPLPEEKSRLVIANAKRVFQEAWARAEARAER
jgi:sugar phosphate isomerase/epimerase